MYTRPTSPSRAGNCRAGSRTVKISPGKQQCLKAGVRPYARGQHTSPDHRPALRHLQTQQTAQTLQFSLRFTTGDEFLMQTRDFIPQTVIFLLYINQRQVTFPYRTDAVAHSMHRAEHPPGNLQSGVRRQPVPLPRALIPGINAQKRQQCQYNGYDNPTSAHDLSSSCALQRTGYTRRQDGTPRLFSLTENTGTDSSGAFRISFP